jgi:hypothetical protein
MYLNSSGWNSFQTSCPLCFFEELWLYVQYNLFYILVLFLLGIKSDGNCQLIPPAHTVSFLSLFFVSGLDMLCHFVVSYHPFRQRWRETDVVFQSLKFNQSVSHVCGSISNVLVAELVMLVSVTYSIQHDLEGLLSLILPGSISLKWLALC